MNSFRRLVGGNATIDKVDQVIELANVQLIAVKISTMDERFQPDSVFVVMKTVPGNETFETQRQHENICLISSFTNQWFFRDSFDMNREAKIIIQVMATFDDKSPVLLGGLTTSLATLTTFAVDLELSMNDFRLPVSFESDVTSAVQCNGVLSIRVLPTGKSRILSADGTTMSGVIMNSALPGNDASATSMTTAAIPTATAGGTATTAAAPPSEIIKTPKQISSRGHRRVIGSIRCTIWQGKAFATSCPCFVTVNLVTQRSQGCRTPTKSNPHNPVFDYIADIPIYSLQGDLILEVWEEHLSGIAYHLGQVIVPFSYLLHGDQCNSTRNPLEAAQVYFDTMNTNHPTITTKKSWYEVFPPSKPTPFNQGGKYRPYKKGLSLNTGYGLARPASSTAAVGFLRLEFVLELKESISMSILRNPWTYAPREPDIELDEDEFALSAVMVAGFTMLDIFNYLWDPPLLRKISEVLNWTCHPALTIVVLFVFSHMALIAAPWQYPFYMLFLLAMIGVAAAYDRNYGDVKAFDDQSDKKGTEKEEKADKSYSEMFKEMKQTAVVMEKSVQLALSTLTRFNNLFIWADPIMTFITFAILFFMACCISCMLLIFSPNQVFWFGGLSFFTPPELQDYIIEVIFQRINRFQEYLLSQGKKSAPVVEKRIGDTELQSIYSQSSSVAVTTNPLSPSSKQTASIKNSVSTDEAAVVGDGSPDDEVDFEHFSSKLFSYTWLKTQAYKWLKMVPDDLELSHRFICSLEVITAYQESSRLPTKKMQLTTADKDAMSVLLSRGTNKTANSMGDYINAWARGSSIAAVHNSNHNGRFSSAVSTVIRQSRLDSSTSANGSSNNVLSPARNTSVTMDDLDAVPPRTVFDALLFSGHPQLLISAPRGGAAERDTTTRTFRLVVNVLAARGLNVTESSSKAMGSMAAVRSKIYVNLCVQPVSSCKVQYRTGGQPRNPNPIFREEFVFEELGGDAMFLVVDVSRKSAMQARAWETFLGQAVISLESILEENGGFEELLNNNSNNSNSRSTMSARLPTPVPLLSTSTSPTDKAKATTNIPSFASPPKSPEDRSVTGESEAPSPPAAETSSRAKSASFSYDSTSVFGQSNHKSVSRGLGKMPTEGARPRYELDREICVWYPLTDKVSGAATVGSNDAAIQLSLKLSMNI